MTRPSLQVHADEFNIPAADVPCDWMWDLIDYLSCQRIRVQYDFRPMFVRVTFPSQTLAGAQQILEGWTRASICSPAAT